MSRAFPPTFDAPMHSSLQTQIIYAHQSNTSFQITYLKNNDHVKQLKLSHYIVQELPLKLPLIQCRDDLSAHLKLKIDILIHKLCKS